MYIIQEGFSASLLTTGFLLFPATLKGFNFFLGLSTSKSNFFLSWLRTVKSRPKSFSPVRRFSGEGDVRFWDIFYLFQALRARSVWETPRSRISFLKVKACQLLNQALISDHITDLKDAERAFRILS